MALMSTHSLLDSLGEDTASIQPLNRINVGYCLTDRSDARTQKIRKIRAETGQLLHELMAYFHTKREDDVENIKVLVKVQSIRITITLLWTLCASI